MLAAQRGGEPPRNEAVHDLHMLYVARRRHHVEQRAVQMRPDREPPARIPREVFLLEIL